jgi:hypothetical protein
MSDAGPVRLVSRSVVVLAVVLLLALFLGCMSLQIGGRRSVEVPVGDGLIEQTGTVTLTGHEAQKVYYPIPYVSTPNLTLCDKWPCGHWEIIDQQWDHFTVRRSGHSWGSPLELTWTAKGLKGPPPPAPVAVLPAERLPPKPIPVAPEK